MNTRSAVLLLPFFAFCRNALSQDRAITGKATYEIASDVVHQTLDVWFSSEEYLYQYRQMTDARELPAFKNKKYDNLQDSLEDVKNIERLNNSLKTMPVQYWYGKLGSDEIIYSSFDNSHKTYCIRDTITFVKWELLPDTLTVHGLPCQKASGSYRDVTYTAWFAPSIPVSVAPLQFRGLPGLLIRVLNNVTKVSFSVTDLEWPAKTPVAIQPCSRSPFVTKNEMQEIRNAQNASQYKMLDAYRKELKDKKKQ